MTLSKNVLVALFLLMMCSAPSLFAAEGPPEEVRRAFEMLSQRYENGYDDPAPFIAFVKTLATPEVIRLNHLNLTEGTLHFRAGRWQEAYQAYGSASIEGYPLEAGVRYRMGQCALQLNRYPAAVKHFEDALKATDSSFFKIKILFALAEAHLANGNRRSLERTVKRINRIKASRSNRREIALVRAKLFLSQGKVGQANSLLVKLISRSHLDTVAREAGALILSQKKEVYLRHLSSEFALRKLARFLYKTADFSGSLEITRRYLRKYRKSRHFGEMVGLAGDCSYRLQDYAQALTHYRRRITLSRKKTITAYYRRKIGRIYQKKGELDTAISTYRQILRQYPRLKSVYTHLSLAYCYELKGRYIEAIAMYTRLLKKNPSPKIKAETCYRIAWDYWIMEQMENSLAYFGRVIEKYEASDRFEEALYWKYRILEAKKRKAEAAKALNSLITHFPESIYLQTIPKVRVQTKKSMVQKLEGMSIVQKKLWKALQDGSILPFPKLTLSTDDAKKRWTTSELSDLEIGQLYRFHFDYELALDYLVQYQRVHWDDGQLLLTLIRLFAREGEYKRSLYYADSYRSVFEGNLLFSLLPRHIKLLFFPFHYASIIEFASQRYGLDRCLLASLILQESKFSAKALSAAGARGLMQLMPQTARQMKGKMEDKHPPGQGHHSPKLNVSIGSFYLKHLFTLFGDDPAAVLAAYNAGEDAVGEWFVAANKKSQKNWDWTMTIAHIRYGETRRYVKKILKNYSVYRVLYCQHLP